MHFLLMLLVMAILSVPFALFIVIPFLTWLMEPTEVWLERRNDKERRRNERRLRSQQPIEWL